MQWHEYFSVIVTPHLIHQNDICLFRKSLHDQDPSTNGSFQLACTESPSAHYKKVTFCYVAFPTPPVVVPVFYIPNLKKKLQRKLERYTVDFGPGVGIVKVSLRKHFDM